jgi:hypothetical protein
MYIEEYIDICAFQTSKNANEWTHAPSFLPEVVGQSAAPEGDEPRDKVGAVMVAPRCSSGLIMIIEMPGIEDRQDRPDLIDLRAVVPNDGPDEAVGQRLQSGTCMAWK